MRSFHAFAAALALAGLVTAGAALPSYADPATPEPQPVLPEVAQAADHAAEQALENAQAALTGAGELEPTLALVELVQALPELEGEDRRAAEGILARPDGDAPLFDGEPRYPAGADRAQCGAHVCIHYVRSGTHAVSLTDRDRDGVPDWVESNLAVMERSWSVQIGSLDYRRPRRDGTRGEIPGKSRTYGKIDVYLAQLPAGLFGYAQPEGDPRATSDGLARTNTAHMVLDKDFSGFSCTPMSCLRATAAHEFFHVVQFGYDTHEASWLLESTATWMEERVFDSVNDNRRYLPASSMAQPATPIDHPDGPAWYGNWVFHEFYTQRQGPRVVRDTWERARSVGALIALDRSLRARGPNLQQTFATFAAVSNAPRTYWSEGAAGSYPAARVSSTHTIPSLLSPSATGQAVLADPLTSRNAELRPGTLPTGAQLRITIDAENAYNTATALVVRTSGRIQIVRIPLSSAGDGAATVAFDPAVVSRVILNFGNAWTPDQQATMWRAEAVT